MGRNSKTKQLQRYLLKRTEILTEEMRQWAEADLCLGLEQAIRCDQVKAIKDGNMDEAKAIHDKRIQYLEQAIEILHKCPGCGHTKGDDKHEHDQDAQDAPTS